MNLLMVGQRETYLWFENFRQPLLDQGIIKYRIVHWNRNDGLKGFLGIFEVNAGANNTIMLVLHPLVVGPSCLSHLEFHHYCSYIQSRD